MFALALAPGTARALGKSKRYNPTSPPADRSTVIDTLDPILDVPPQSLDPTINNQHIRMRADSINRTYLSALAPTATGSLNNLIRHNLVYQAIYGPGGLVNSQCATDRRLSCKLSEVSLDVSGAPGVLLDAAVPTRATLRLPAEKSYGFKVTARAKYKVAGLGVLGDFDVAGHVKLKVRFHAEATQYLDGNLPPGSKAAAWDVIGGGKMKSFMFRDFAVKIDGVTAEVGGDDALTDVASAAVDALDFLKKFFVGGGGLRDLATNMIEGEIYRGLDAAFRAQAGNLALFNFPGVTGHDNAGTGPIAVRPAPTNGLDLITEGIHTMREVLTWQRDPVLSRFKPFTQLHDPGVTGGPSTSDLNFIDILFVPEGFVQCKNDDASLMNEGTRLDCDPYFRNSTRFARNVFSEKPFDDASAAGHSPARRLMRLWHANLLQPRPRAQLADAVKPLTDLVEQLVRGSTASALAQSVQLGLPVGAPEAVRNRLIQAINPLPANSTVTGAQIKQRIGNIRNALVLVKAEATAMLGALPPSDLEDWINTAFDFAASIPDNLVVSYHDTLLPANTPPASDAARRAFDKVYVALMSLAFGTVGDQFGPLSLDTSALLSLLKANTGANEALSRRVTYHLSGLASIHERWRSDSVNVRSITPGVEVQPKFPDVTVMMSRGNVRNYTLGDLVQLSLTDAGGYNEKNISVKTANFHDLMHEIAHTRKFGALGEESFDPAEVADPKGLYFGAYQGSEPISPNVSMDAEKWNEKFRINRGQEGATWRAGIFHPTGSCRMASHSHAQGFCGVCSAAINSRLTDHERRANSFNASALKRCVPILSPETGLATLHCG